MGRFSVSNQVTTGQLIGFTITVLVIIIGAWISMRINVAKIETRLLEVEVKIMKMEKVEKEVLTTLIEIKTNQVAILQNSRDTKNNFIRLDEAIRDLYKTNSKK